MNIIIIAATQSAAAAASLCESERSKVLCVEVDALLKTCWPIHPSMSPATTTTTVAPQSPHQVNRTDYAALYAATQMIHAV